MHFTSFNLIYTTYKQREHYPLLSIYPLYTIPNSTAIQKQFSKIKNECCSTVISISHLHLSSCYITSLHQISIMIFYNGLNEFIPLHSNPTFKVEKKLDWAPESNETFSLCILGMQFWSESVFLWCVVLLRCLAPEQCYLVFWWMRYHFDNSVYFEFVTLLKWHWCHIYYGALMQLKSVYTFFYCMSLFELLDDG